MTDVTPGEPHPNDNGVYEKDQDFMPLDLTWSNSVTPERPRGSVLAARIEPDLPRHCDLAHIDGAYQVRQADVEALGVVAGAGEGARVELPAQPDRDLLKFNTEVEPNEVADGIWPTKKPGGTYRLKVAVVADNSRPRYWQLIITFAGAWYDDETEMFENGITVGVE